MGQVTLVRHGQASFGTDNYDNLSPLGHQQSKWLGEFFAEQNRQFDQIICGTLTRHRQTLDGILSAYEQHVNVQSDTRVDEFAFEHIVKAYITQNPEQKPAQDAPRSAFYRLLKQAMFAWQNNQLDNSSLPESWQAFEKRTHGFIQQVCESDAKQVLVVSSGGAISLMIQYILNAPAQTAIELNLQMRNAGITECFYGKGKGSLSLFNSVSYLLSPERKHAQTYS